MGGQSKGGQRGMLVLPLLHLLWPSLFSCDEDVMEVDKRWSSLPNWMQGLRHPFLQHWKSDRLPISTAGGRRDGDESEKYSFKDAPDSSIPMFKLLRLKKWRSLPKMNGRLRFLSSILAQSSLGRDPASILLESPGRAASQMMLQGPTVIQGKPYRL